MASGIVTVSERGASVSVPWGPSGERVEAAVLHFNRATRSVQVTFLRCGKRVTRWFTTDDVKTGGE